MMPLGTEVGLGPDDIVLDGAQLLPPKVGNFRPMSILAKRSPISATAELLLYNWSSCLEYPGWTCSNQRKEDG